MVAGCTQRQRLHNNTHFLKFVELPRNLRSSRWLLIELSVVFTAVATWQIYSALRPPLLCERGPDPHIQRGFESISRALHSTRQDWSRAAQPYTTHIQSEVCHKHPLSSLAHRAGRDNAD
jgi:hypothetical protein